MSSNKNIYRNRWSFYEKCRLFVSLIFTKLFYKKAKLICYPIYIRGKKSMEYGKGLNFGYGCHLDLINVTKKTLFMGDNCEFGDYCHIVALDSVKIGNNFLCGSRVLISDCCHGNYSGYDEEHLSLIPRDKTLVTRPVIIGNNVWVGDNVSILPGVTIGDGAVIGANSVVTSNVEANTVVVGSPAKAIKRYDAKTKKWIKL